jgi:hypothetical protein
VTMEREREDTERGALNIQKRSIPTLTTRFTHSVKLALGPACIYQHGVEACMHYCLGEFLVTYRYRTSVADIRKCAFVDS